MSADVFVYLDTVQFDKNGFQKRNRIKTATGEAWLSVPVRRPHNQPIRELKIADPSALQKHWRTLESNYRHAAGFQAWKEELHALLGTECDTLSEIAIASTEWMLEKLGTDTKRLRASEIPRLTGSGSSLNAAICGYLGATTYLTGTGGTAYLKETDFSVLGCEIWVQTWERLNYHQPHPQGPFRPDLSTIDLLLNCPYRATELISSAGGWKLLWPAE